MFKHKRMLMGTGILLLVLFLTVVPAASVLAFDNRSGTDVNIGVGEVVDSDLYLFGTNITIDGTVNGDVFAFGQNIFVNGTINGGLTAAGQTITMSGKVSRGARVAGQTVNVTGNIERDLVTAGNAVNVTGSAKIGSDLIIGAQASTISGSIRGNIKAGVNKITIGDGVGGNVEIYGDEIIIASTADIKGNVSYVSDNDANILTGSRIGGTISHKLPEPPRSARNLFIAGIVGTIVGRILAFLMMFIIGIILIVIAPKKIMFLANSLRKNPMSSLGWGALLLFITPIAAFIVMFTIIGLPVGIISILLWGIAVYLSEIPVAFLIGWLITGSNRNLESKGTMIGVFALGLFIISLLTAIPVIGWIVWLFAAMFGLGILLSSRRRQSVTTQQQ